MICVGPAPCEVLSKLLACHEERFEVLSSIFEPGHAM